MSIPDLTLLSEAKLPNLGLGTFGSDKYPPEQVAAAVLEAAWMGYRHFDCASIYGNEKEVGASLSSCGVHRQDLWITSKLWNDRHRDPEGACEESLRALGVEYLDLYLIHWPFPHHHAPGVGVDSRDPYARQFNFAAYLETWRGLERLHSRGLVRHIGTSNMTIPKLKLLLREAEIRPAANEMELHPHFQQKELFDFVVSNRIVPIAYSPLGSPSRPHRDRTSADTSDLEDPTILEIAARRHLSPAEVCIKWAITRGQIPIPFSVKTDQLASSLRAAKGEMLSSGEMAAIAQIDKNCRLIKGQVFLWQGAKDWRDLWDEPADMAND